MLVRRKADITLAVDFGADAVRLLEVQKRRGQVTLGAIAEQSLPAGEPETLPERHLEALGGLLRAQRLAACRAVAALPTSMVVTRSVNIDKGKGLTPDEYVRWALENCLPFDSRDLVFDYWPVYDPASGRGQNEVLVVAAQGTLVERYLHGMGQLKLRCAHLDTAPCAIASLLGRCVEDPGAMSGVVALSERMGYFAIVERGRVAFWRPFDLPHAQTDETNRQANTDRIGDEISKCMSHMVGSMQVDNLGAMLLFGHGAEELVGSGYLRQRFQLEVRAPSPFAALPAASWPADLDRAQLTHTTHYCTAVGLAVQEAAGGLAHG